MFQNLKEDVFVKSAQKKDNYRVAQVPAGAGRENNPIQIDFSTGKSEKVTNNICPYGGTSFYDITEDAPTYDPAIKTNCTAAIIDAFELYESELREMQWNGGECSQEFYLDCERKYARLEDKSEFPTFESFYDFKKNKILEAVEAQKEDLKNIEPTKEDHYFWRGLYLSENTTRNPMSNQDRFTRYINRSEIGDVIVPDWASLCTSSDIKTTEPYCYNALFRIKAPKGSRLFNVGIENEVRFPSKSEFKVTGKTDWGDLKIIELEYIPPEFN